VGGVTLCFFKKNNIQLEMNMVIKNLGYNRVESIPKRILKEIKNSIDEVKDLIQLEIIWQEYEFEIDKKKHRIKFSEDIYI